MSEDKSEQKRLERIEKLLTEKDKHNERELAAQTKRDDLAKALEASLKRQNDLSSESTDLTKRLFDNQKKISDYQRGYNKLMGLNLSQYKTRAALVRQQQKLDRDSADLSRQLLVEVDDGKKAQLEAERAIVDQQIKKNKLAQENSTTSISNNHNLLFNIKQRIKPLNEELGILNSSLDCLVEQKKAQKDITDKAIIDLETAEAQLALEKKRTELFEEFGGITKKYESAMKMANNSALAVVGIFTMAVDRFKELDATASDFRKNTGLGKNVTEKLSGSIEKMSLKYGAFGIGVKEAYESAQAVLETFGSMNSSTEANTDTVVRLKTNLGVANDNAAGFVAYMQQAGGLTSEQTENMAGFASNLADAAKVPLNQVMKDVAHASDKAKAMTGGSVINLIKASVQARKLGVDLNKVADSARGMLDFNESINSELEASVILGKNLSFMDARRAAFAGDLAGAQEATLKQVEKMGDFNKLNVLQQEALAKASGYSVTDLQKMIAQKKDFARLTDKEKADYKKLMDMKKESAKDDNSARDKLQEMQMQSATESLSNSWKTIKNAMVQVFVPFMQFLAKGVPYVVGFANGFGKLMSNISGVTGVVTGATAAILLMYGALKTLKMSSGIGKAVGKTVGSIKDKILDKITGSNALDKIQNVADKTKPAAGEGFKKFMKNFATGIGYLGNKNTLKGIGALLGMSAALVVAAYGFSLFSKVKWEDIGVAVLAIAALTGAIFALGFLFSGPQLAVLLLGMGILAGLGVSLIPLASAMTLAGFGMGLMADSLGKLMPYLSELASLSTGLLSAATAITALGAAFAVFGAGQAAGGLTSFVGNLLGSQMKDLQKLAELGPQLQVTANALKTINNPNGDSGSSNSTSTTSNSSSGGGVEKKLDLILEALTTGKVVVYLDGRKVSQGLASIA